MIENINFLKEYLNQNKDILKENEITMIKEQIVILEKAYENIQKNLLDIESEENLQKKINEELTGLNGIAYV